LIEKAQQGVEFMEKLSEITTLEFKYDSEAERQEHVNFMVGLGYRCSGQVRRSDDSLMDENRNYYWYAHFSKIF
jgi:hypothetical protein